MPSIVIKGEFKDVANVKRGVAKWNNYATREEAADPSQISDEDLLHSINYQEEKATYAWDNNGDVNILEELKIEQTLNRSGKLWDMFISFDHQFVKEVNLLNKADYYKLTKNVIPKFLLSANFNLSNVKWYSTLHLNTDNPHIHILFYEIKEVTKMGIIPQKHFSNLKKYINSYLVNNNEFYKSKAIDIKEIREIVTKNKLNTPDKKILFSGSYRKQLNQKLLSLYSKLRDTGRLQYNSIGMKEHKKEIDQIVEYILSHYSLRYKYERYYFRLQDFNKINEKMYGKSQKNYVENQLNNLYERIGNDILKGYKIYNSNSFIETEREFLKNNIMTLKLKSRSLETNRTFIKKSTDLYRLCMMADLNDDQVIVLFNNWKTRSKHDFNVLQTIEELKKVEYSDFTKEEYIKALRSLGYNSKKYLNIKNSNFYKEIKFRKFYYSALNNLIQENEKIDEEILDMKERELDVKEKNN
ncbi:MAG: relaxase MobL [Bacilli bacterium]|nr:relaxase MobL [Bacilli bacterium]